MVNLVSECRHTRFIRSVDAWEERRELVATETGEIVPMMMPFRAIQCDMLQIPERVGPGKKAGYYYGWGFISEARIQAESTRVWYQP